MKKGSIDAVGNARKKGSIYSIDNVEKNSIYAVDNVEKGSIDELDISRKMLY